MHSGTNEITSNSNTMIQDDIHAKHSRINGPSRDHVRECEQTAVPVQRRVLRECGDILDGVLHHE